MSKVYVSSTFDDLQDCREKIRIALRRMEHEDLAIEYYVAEDARPLDKCLEHVRRADVYLGIFAHRYGFVPDGHEHSITELEYRAAREAGKDCLILLLQDKASWPFDRIELGAIGRIKALRTELERAHSVSYFTGTTDIDVRVMEAVHAWEKRRGISRAPAAGWDGYRAAVVNAHQWVRLSVIAGAQQDRIARIPLVEVFTPQLAVARLPMADLPPEVLKYREELFERDGQPDTAGGEASPHGDDSGDGIVEQLESEPDELGDNLPQVGLELLGRERTQVILGTPGSGKSTFLECAALLLCEPEGIREYPLPQLEERPVPLLIDLRHFALRKNRSFLEYLAASAGERYGHAIEVAALARQLQDKPTILLFDGLDEVFDRKARTWVVRQITALADAFSQARLVLTSRIVGYDPSALYLAGFKHYTFIEFNAQQIDEFVRRWYQHYTWEGDERGADALIQRIAESPRLRELAGNPLLLTMMAVLFKHQDLPEQRWKLYERCTDVLLEDWDLKRKDIDLKTLLPLDITVRAAQKAEILQRVSMFMLEHSDARSELNAIAAEPLMRILARYLEEKYGKPPGEAAAIAQGILNHLRERTHILAEIGTKVFGFVHRTFMEYFAASQCTAEFNRRRADYDWLRKLFRGHWDQDQWQEVLLLLTGMLADQRSPIRDIIEDLRKLSLPGPPLHLAFAVQCLAEAGHVDDDRGAAGLVAALVDEIAVYAEKSSSSPNIAHFVDTGSAAFTRVTPLVAVRANSLEKIERLSTASKPRTRIVGWQMGLATRPPEERLSYTLTALSNKDEAIRRAAIAALEREWPGRPEAGDALINVVRDDKRVRVRRSALDALQRNWPPKAAILDSMAAHAESESTYTAVCYNIAYLERAFRQDPRAPQLVLQLARSFVERSSNADEVDGVVAAATSTLARTWRDDADLLALVFDWVAGTDSWQTGALAGTVGAAWGSRRDALGTLLTIVRADEASDRRRAAVAMLGAGWPNDPDAQQVLSSVARGDPDSSARSWAVLAAAGVRGVPPELDTRVRWMFGQGVATGWTGDGTPSRFPSHGQTDLLRCVAAGDQDPRVRWLAIFALVATSVGGPARRVTILDCVAHEHDGRVRALAAILLDPRWFGKADDVEDDAATATLLDATSHFNPRVAATAVRALTTIEVPPRYAIARVIDEKARDGDANVRAAVAGGWPVTPIPLLLELMAEDPDPMVRATAASSLIASLSHRDDALRCWKAVSRSAVEDPDPSVRHQILAALTTLPSVAWACSPSLRGRLPQVAHEAVVAMTLGLDRDVVWHPWFFDRLGFRGLLLDRAQHETNDSVRTLAQLIHDAAFGWPRSLHEDSDAAES